ncbi:manganese-dependent inorganic pyrophosphatase [Clostridium niameyense]|uniref:manganese-dependent inorganic pyrophosphatase n=1 Tax=Clostridium niameyense TaxID=1622073 RepID=UPI00067F3A10|nr:manganese-dependent inorganic pyrophosphatase [Clostridium niameyense]
MNDFIYITGHKNPDTDSICAALCYANLKRELGFKNAEAIRLGDINNETQFVLDYFNVDAPKLMKSIEPNTKIILVDHNEKNQSIDGLDEAELLEIIDHHRIGGISTASPIYFRNEPVGSSSTIVANMYFEKGITPAKEIAGLLSSAIISDTLLFKSPTSTDLDRNTLAKLAKVAEINPKTYSLEMFKAGTSLKGKTVEELYNSDFKDFNIAGHKMGVGQVSTMDATSFDPLKEKMIKYMEEKKQKGNYKDLVLILTDLLKEGSFIYVVGEHKDTIASAFNKPLENGYSLYAEGVLSRKKQVIPPITESMTNK